MNGSWTGTPLALKRLALKRKKARQPMPSLLIARTSNLGGALDVGGQQEGDADTHEKVIEEAVVIFGDCQIGIKIETGGIVGEEVIANREVESNPVIHEDVDAAAEVEAWLETAVEHGIVVGIVVGNNDIAHLVHAARRRRIVTDCTVAVVGELGEGETALEVEVKVHKELSKGRKLAVPRRHADIDRSVKGHAV